MLKDKIQKALTDQLKLELDSSYLYLSMSAFFEAENLSGFANWLRVQSQEEYGHAMKLFDYIHHINGRIDLETLEAPKSKWKNYLDIFEDVYKHEQKVSEAVNNLVDLAIELKDHATHSFMLWFVNEQVEEEDTALKILEKVKLIGDNRNGIFLLDREMGMRARG